MTRSQNNRGAGSRLVLWLWSISFTCVVGLSSACQGVSQVGLEVQPEGLVAVRYGNALDLHCSTTDDNYTADDIEIRFDGLSVSSEKINTTTRRLYIEKPKKGVFTYYCFNKETKKTCTSRVLVDSPPVDVTDFTCKSYNLEELNCSWTSSNEYALKKYSLGFIVNGLRMDSCLVQRSFNRRSCTWNVTSVPRYRQYERFYRFVLTSTNMFGDLEQNFMIDHYSIVKPGPVRDLKILGVGAYSVLLQWKIPNNMIDLLPVGLQHKIEYRIVGNNRKISSFRRVEASSLPKKNSTYNFNITLPKAHVQYEVRISIRLETAAGEEYWSEYSSIFFYTNGKSVQEINESIYQNWRQNVRRPIPDFEKKLWHMKAEKALYKNWHPTQNFGPLSVLFQLMPATSEVESSHGGSVIQKLIATGS